jgi:DNA-binding MarR family transcriptional regulator
MSSPFSTREELVAVVSGQLGLELSTATVLFHALVAERLGLGPTDHKAFNIIERSGPLTAGDLAKLIGLTTGAITGVVDRLERAGYVQRTSDPHDRRKVVIEVCPSPERDALLAEIFAPLARSITDLCAHYSDAELTAIHDFMKEGIGVLQQHIARLGAIPLKKDDEPTAARRAPRQGRQDLRGSEGG